jgi:homoserine kinase
MISLREAIQLWGNTAAVIAALYKSDFDLLKRSISDPSIEPSRASQIPNFYGLKDVAFKSGAVGFGVSGSGPAVFALADSQEKAAHISLRLSDYYKSSGIPFKTYVSKINKSGPKIVQD